MQKDILQDTFRIEIGKLKPNPKNPRIIRNHKYLELLESIRSLPEMLKVRPICVDNDMVILGGNQRHKACLELGLTHVYALNLDKIFTKEQQKEFIIKDNVSFGEWDWDILAQDWVAEKLNEWGLPVWTNKIETAEFKPTIFPEQSNSQITEDDIKEGKETLGDNLHKGTERKYLECMCPECGHEFNVEVEK